LVKNLEEKRILLVEDEREEEEEKKPLDWICYSYNNEREEKKRNLLDE
jgi:hypothetical protein